MTLPHIIDGRKHALNIKTDLSKAVEKLKKSYDLTPQLAIVQVGDHAASHVYIQAKLKECHLLSIKASLHQLSIDVTQSDIEKLIYQLNADPFVHGIIVQLPLPLHLDYFSLIEGIYPSKDVDGLHPINQGALVGGNFKKMIPCTPLGCLALMAYEMTSFKGKKVAIIGCSKLVGLPLGIILASHGCTVTLINTSTIDPAQITAQADIIIAAAGSPYLVTEQWLKAGSIIIDVGITRVMKSDHTSKLCGDVNFDSVKDIVGKITPVPGGVGPMTIAFLLTNTVIAAYQSINQCMVDNPVTKIFDKLKV